VKWFTIILAIGILALNVTPLTELFVGPACVEQSSCCSKKAVVESSQDEDKSCDQDVCNPFLSCCAPVLMIPTVDDISMDVNVIELKHESFYRSLSGLLIECEVWQPPEELA